MSPLTHMRPWEKALLISPYHASDVRLNLRVTNRDAQTLAPSNRHFLTHKDSHVKKKGTPNKASHRPV